MSYDGVIDFHQTAEYRRGLRQLEAWHDQCRRKRLGIYKVGTCHKCGVELTASNYRVFGRDFYCMICAHELNMKKWARRKARMMAERAKEAAV